MRHPGERDVWPSCRCAPHPELPERPSATGSSDACPGPFCSQGTAGQQRGTRSPTEAVQTPELNRELAFRHCVPTIHTAAGKLQA